MRHELPKPLVDYFDNSRVALALASCAPDNPLLLVNEPFRQLTGYSAADVVGHNCRLLQGDAENRQPRLRIREFLANDRQPNIRVAIVNIRKDGTPFINLLYMSRLRARDGETRYFFASQFDVSRSQPEMLADYEKELGATLRDLKPIAGDAGIVIDGTLMTIASTAATIAQAKMMLADLELAQND